MSGYGEMMSRIRCAVWWNPLSKTKEAVSDHHILNVGGLGFPNREIIN